MNASGLCLMPRMTQCLAPCRVQWVQKGSNQEMSPWVIAYIFINHVCYLSEVHTIIYMHVKVLQRAFNKEFPISRNSKGAGEETWGLCLALCLAQRGCSGCENFRVVFVQDNLAGRETKLIKEKSQAVVCMELLLILVGCRSACATIEADSKAWMVWVAKDPKQEYLSHIFLSLWLIQRVRGGGMPGAIF